MAIDIQPTGGHTGAIVKGFDRDELTPGVEQRLHDAFLEYGVLVFTGLDDLDARNADGDRNDLWTAFAAARDPGIAPSRSALHPAARRERRQARRR